MTAMRSGSVCGPDAPEHLGSAGHHGWRGTTADRSRNVALSARSAMPLPYCVEVACIFPSCPYPRIGYARRCRAQHRCSAGSRARMRVSPSEARSAIVRGRAARTMSIGLELRAAPRFRLHQGTLQSASRSACVQSRSVKKRWSSVGKAVSVMAFPPHPMQPRPGPTPVPAVRAPPRYTNRYDQDWRAPAKWSV